MSAAWGDETDDECSDENENGVSTSDAAPPTGLPSRSWERWRVCEAGVEVMVEEGGGDVENDDSEEEMLSSPVSCDDTFFTGGVAWSLPVAG